MLNQLRPQGPSNRTHCFHARVPPSVTFLLFVMHLSSSLSSLYNLFSPLKLPVRGRNNSRQGLEPAGDPKASGQPIPNYYYSERSPGQFHKKRLRSNPHIAHLRSTYYAASLILTLNLPFHTLPSPLITQVAEAGQFFFECQNHHHTNSAAPWGRSPSPSPRTIYLAGEDNQ